MVIKQTLFILEMIIIGLYLLLILLMFLEQRLRIIHRLEASQVVKASLILVESDSGIDHFVYLLTSLRDILPQRRNNILLANGMSSHRSAFHFGEVEVLFVNIHTLMFCLVIKISIGFVHFGDNFCRLLLHFF